MGGQRACTVDAIIETWCLRCVFTLKELNWILNDYLKVQVSFWGLNSSPFLYVYYDSSNIMKKEFQLWIYSGLRPIPASKTDAELQITGNAESQVNSRLWHYCVSIWGKPTVKGPLVGEPLTVVGMFLTKASQDTHLITFMCMVVWRTQEEVTNDSVFTYGHPAKPFVQFMRF